ncbi:DinB family protein [Ignavibacterium album]|uniref:DinB family protein n=1 Tax=Ignavibacterium album TaxID=591197 RepID=UPI0035BB6C94
MRQTIKELREIFISDSESFINEINKLYSLSENELNWKATSETWSIAECIDHLAVTNKLYFNKMEKQFAEKQIICIDSKEYVKHKFL